MNTRLEYIGSHMMTNCPISEQRQYQKLTLGQVKSKLLKLLIGNLVNSSHCVVGPYGNTYIFWPLT